MRGLVPGQKHNSFLQTRSSEPFLGRRANPFSDGRDMTDSKNNEPGTALHELVQIEIAVPNLDIPGEQKLQEALHKIQGIEMMAVADSKVKASYDPTRVTAAELRAAIEREGFTAAESDVERTSPLAELEVAEASTPERPREIAE